MRYCKVTIQLSDISARVYNSLYSLQSLNDMDQLRMSKALELCEELKGIKRERESIKDHFLQNIEEIYGDKMSQVIYLADELQYLLILTLVHRAVPPPAGSTTAFSDACQLC
ncbi:unnamed protein product [Clonostachys rhizophaga]|uniref:Uncharacterized protein n=1 Tax=Clonostachys rhizophaga TaxID=160324 RepID=A0A9N9VVY0_9HYPO|nr:unnamed protein product [Clonostachys rhizophaga]